MDGWMDGRTRSVPNLESLISDGGSADIDWSRWFFHGRVDKIDNWSIAGRGNCKPGFAKFIIYWLDTYGLVIRVRRI
jgi:hypothetical protein